MSVEITVALIVAFGTILSPVLLSMIQGSQRRRERMEDYARQDRVAAQAAEAAKLMLESSRRVAKTARTTNKKLDVIHTLVNSQLTAAMQAEHDAVVRELAMMREVVQLQKLAGHEPSAAALTAIEITEAKIIELDLKLKEREKQTEKADKQAKDAKKVEEEPGE